jgi:hypothetical protein
MFSHAGTLCCRLVHQLLDFHALFGNVQTAYWRQLDGKATRLYSAVGLLTAQRLQAVLRVPIGIIQVRMVSGFVAVVVRSSAPLLHLRRAAAEQAATQLMAAIWAAMAATMQRALQSSQSRAQPTGPCAAQVAWPGSSIQSWIDRGSIAAVDRGVARVAGARLSGASSAAKSFAPSMLRPLRGIPFNSVIWWQGWGAQPPCV